MALVIPYITGSLRYWPTSSSYLLCTCDQCDHTCRDTCGATYEQSVLSRLNVPFNDTYDHTLYTGSKINEDNYLSFIVWLSLFAILHVHLFNQIDGEKRKHSQDLFSKVEQILYLKIYITGRLNVKYLLALNSFIFFIFREKREGDYRQMNIENWTGNKKTYPEFISSHYVHVCATVKIIEKFEDNILSD